ncbi:hypothetical protein DFH09DRAFT_658509 [Mycena vulgaris]|nr:hypothetical protein DFH09DRAFT_658509 [Mycena vulgaris]
MVKEGEYRLLFMYPCRSRLAVNLVALYADPHQDDPDWAPTGTREELLQTFHDIHPKFLAFLALADSPILKWQLRVLPVLPTWIRGRAALLGDSAHANLPTLGQGAAMAIEEAGALGCLLPLGTRREDVPSRLEAYQILRKPRGDYVNRESLAQGAEPSKRGDVCAVYEFRLLLNTDLVRQLRKCNPIYFSTMPSTRPKLTTKNISGHSN